MKEVIIRQYDMHDIIVRSSEYASGAFIYTSQRNKDGVIETQVVEQIHLKELISALQQFLPKEEEK